MNYYKINVRPIEQKLAFKVKGKKKYKLKDGSDAFYFSTRVPTIKVQLPSL